MTYVLCVNGSGISSVKHGVALAALAAYMARLLARGNINNNIA